MIPLHEPYLDERDVERVADCIRSGWVSSAGPQVEEFERRVARMTWREGAVGVSSGTAALHLALKAVGVGPGDWVMVPAMSFIATANAVMYCQAVPFPVDVHEFALMDVEELRKRLEEVRPKAVVVTHLLGNMHGIDGIAALLREYEIPLIEDAAQAFGCHTAGRWGRLGCFSFNGNKTITCGGGGMVVGDEEDISRVRYLATQAVDDPVKFEHKEIGFNYRMPALVAALGLSQLDKLDEIKDLKRRIFQNYDRAFKSCGEISSFTSEWLYTIEHADAGPVVSALRERGIGARRAWLPLPLVQAYSGICDKWMLSCPKALDLHRRLVLLPSSPGLTEDQQGQVVDAVKSVCR